MLQIISSYLLIGILFNLLFDLFYDWLSKNQNQLDMSEEETEKFDTFTKIMCALLWPIITVWIIAILIYRYNNN